MGAKNEDGDTQDYVGLQWSLSISLLFLWEEHPTAALSQREGFDIQSTNLVQSPVWTWVCFLYFFYHFFFFLKYHISLGAINYSCKPQTTSDSGRLSYQHTQDSRKQQVLFLRLRCLLASSSWSHVPLSMDPDVSEHLTVPLGFCLWLRVQPHCLFFILISVTWLWFLEASCSLKAFFPPVLSRAILVFSLE